MMKKKLRASLGTLIAILLTVSLALNAFAAAIGHAVYRDLDSNNDFLRDQGHAGIVYQCSGSTPAIIIHHPGGFLLESSHIEKVTFNEFKYPDSNTALNYYGSYYRPGATVYTQIVTLADTLCENYNITYVFNRQLSLKWSVNTIVDRIEPVDILSIRCDGLVEYCYEYHGIQLLGSSTHWNISNPDHYTSHVGLLSHTPKAQRDLLTPS